MPLCIFKGTSSCKSAVWFSGGVVKMGNRTWHWSEASVGCVLKRKASSSHPTSPLKHDYWGKGEWCNPYGLFKRKVHAQIGAGWRTALLNSDLFTPLKPLWWYQFLATSYGNGTDEKLIFHNFTIPSASPTWDLWIVCSSNQDLQPPDPNIEDHQENARGINMHPGWKECLLEGKEYYLKQVNRRMNHDKSPGQPGQTILIH